MAAVVEHDSALERAWRSLVLHRSLAEDILATLGTAQAAATAPEDALLLRALPERLVRSSEACAANAALLERAAAAAGAPGVADASHLAAAARDLPDVCRALRRLAADWSAGGASWRAATYQPVVDAVRAACADEDDNDDFAVLVPGAGCGRLAWEIARHSGAMVQGCEGDYAQLFLSNFALNSTAPGDAVVFPHALRVDGGTVEEGEELPDVDTSDLPTDSNLSMCAGRFMKLYKEEAQWNCVATCMFLERCEDVVLAIQRIAHVLRVGGVWVNHGTLDYSRRDGAEDAAETTVDDSIQVTEEELFRILPRLGLRVVSRERRKIPDFNASDDVIKDVFESVFFVAVRV